MSSLSRLRASDALDGGDSQAMMLADELDVIDHQYGDTGANLAKLMLARMPVDDDDLDDDLERDVGERGVDLGDSDDSDDAFLAQLGGQKKSARKKDAGAKRVLSDKERRRRERRERERAEGVLDDLGGGRDDWGGEGGGENPAIVEAEQDLVVCIQMLGVVLDGQEAGAGAGATVVASSRVVEALKGLSFLIRNEDELNRHTTKNLIKWGTYRKYLIPLLVSYRDNDEIVFLTLKVLTRLTMPFEAHADEPDARLDATAMEAWQLLAPVREAVLRSDVLAVLNGWVQDVIATHPTKRSERERDALELLLCFWRNLLRVPNSPRPGNDQERFQHDRLVAKLNEDLSLEILLILIQTVNEEPAISIKYNLLLLELVALIFRDDISRGKNAATAAEEMMLRVVHTEAVDRIKQTAAASGLQLSSDAVNVAARFDEAARLERERKQSGAAGGLRYSLSRHPRFGGTIVASKSAMNMFLDDPKAKRSKASPGDVSGSRGGGGGGSDSDQGDDDDEDSHKKPMRRRNLIHNIFQQRLGGAGVLPNQRRQRRRLRRGVFPETVPRRVYASEAVRQVYTKFALRIVSEGALGELFQSLFPTLRRREEGVVSDVFASDFANLFRVFAFLLAFYRLRATQQRRKAHEAIKTHLKNGVPEQVLEPEKRALEAARYDARPVFAALNPAVFSWVLDVLDADLQRKPQPWSKLVPAVDMLSEMVRAVYEMNAHGQEQSKADGVTLRRKVFYEADNFQVLAKLTEAVQPRFQPKGFLDSLVVCTHYVFKMLRDLSRGNMFVVLGKKRKVRRKKADKDGEGDDAGDDAAAAADGPDDDEVEFEYVQRERMFEFRKFFKMFMRPNVFKHFIVSLDHYSDNAADVNSALCRIFSLLVTASDEFRKRSKTRDRAKALVESQSGLDLDMDLVPLLFQLSTFEVLNTLIEDRAHAKRHAEVAQLREFAKLVVRRFVRLSKQNPLVFAEALFFKPLSLLPEVVDPNLTQQERLIDAEERKRQATAALEDEDESALADEAELDSDISRLKLKEGQVLGEGIINRKQFTRQEDDLLRDLFDAFRNEPDRWEMVAMSVPSRNARQCERRAIRLGLLDDGIKRKRTRSSRGAAADDDEDEPADVAVQMPRERWTQEHRSDEVEQIQQFVQDALDMGDSSAIDWLCAALKRCQRQRQRLLDQLVEVPASVQSAHAFALVPGSALEWDFVPTAEDRESDSKAVLEGIFELFGFEPPNQERGARFWRVPGRVGCEELAEMLKLLAAEGETEGGSVSGGSLALLESLREGPDVVEEVVVVEEEQEEEVEVEEEVQKAPKRAKRGKKKVVGKEEVLVDKEVVVVDKDEVIEKHQDEDDGQVYDDFDDDDEHMTPKRSKGGRRRRRLVRLGDSDDEEDGDEAGAAVEVMPDVQPVTPTRKRKLVLSSDDESDDEDEDEDGDDAMADAQAAAEPAASKRRRVVSESPDDSSDE